MVTSTVPMLDDALSYAKMGFPVFRLGVKLKVPLAKTNGLLDATLDETKLKEWWAGIPYNIGCNPPVDIAILDVDMNHENQANGIASLKTFTDQFGDLPKTRTHRTGGGGLHLFFRLPKGITLPKPDTEIAPGLEIITNRHYVVLPPSIHPSSKPYEVISDSPIVDIPTWLLLATQTKIQQSQAVARQPATDGVKDIPHHQRDIRLTSIAGTLRNQGLDGEELCMTLQAINLKRCDPPCDESQVRKIANSISRKPINGPPVPPRINVHTYICATANSVGTERNKNATDFATNGVTDAQETQQPLSERIENWVRGSNAWFLTDELDRDLGISATTDKNNRREVMLRLEAKGVVERHAKENKKWRFVNNAFVKINFKSSETVPALDVKFPLELEQLVKVFPGNLVVVAGATNSGKTAMMLDFIYRNQAHRLPMYYFCSEMGDSELKNRLSMFDDISLEDWNFTAIDRSTNFEDVIVPDAINIVDFLELTEEMWVVNTHLTAICKRIGSGLAIVCIQKKVGEKWGRGQEFSAEKSKLYLSMDENRVTVTKGKSWAVRGFNPNNLFTRFTVVDGCRLRRTGEWQKKTMNGYEVVKIPQQPPQHGTQQKRNSEDFDDFDV